MEIKINPQTINLSPHTEKGDTLEETLELIEQLEKQFLYGDNACFLVSGYRGTGKTTLIHTLEAQIKDDNVIFVHLNISKYENYSLILRRLIREIYLTFSSTDKYKEVKNRNKEITDKLELLYEHTFYEIQHNLNYKEIKEKNSNVTGIFSLKEIIIHSIPIIALIVSNFIDIFNITGELIKDLEVVWLIGSLVSIIVGSVKIKSEFSIKNNSTEELVRKSLYDDEIAEYHLKNILGQLKSEGIKMVVVFDEVDKIEEENEVKKIISEMKPLLLSGLASFILISGQKLYYKFIDANTIDDSIMSSIFTKNIHVPLARNITLVKLFEKYTYDKIDIENDIVKSYVHSLILNSNRIVRKFVSLILEDIYWVNEECYLKIEEDDLKQFNTNSELLKIIDNITKEYIDDSEYENGIKDFFTYQLFIWIKKMKRKGKLEFHRYEIFKLEENYSEMYPRWCEIKLNDLCSTLLETLVSNALLEKKTSDDEEIYYKWTNKVKIKSEEIEDEITSIKISLLENIIDLEAWARYALLMVNPKEHNKVSLIMLIKKLINKGVISDMWMNEERIELYSLTNKIRHGEKIDSSQIYLLENNNNLKIIII